MRVLAVTNLYPMPHSPTAGTFVKQSVEGLRRAGVDVKVLFVDRVGLGTRAYLGLRRRLGRELEAFRPDVVHVMYGGLLAEVVTRFVRNCPVVVSFCGTDLLGGTFWAPLTRLTVRLGVIASHLAAKRASAIIAKSSNLRRALPASVDSSKVWVVPNGVDLEMFRPMDRAAARTELGWKDDCFHVLTPAHRGAPVKRLKLAQAVVETLQLEEPAATLHQLAGVPHSLVPLWMNAGEAVLLTSYHEGSPNVVKEALACNVPVVSVDVGDVRERIQGVEGCYLARSERDDLAAKLRRVLAGPGRVKGRETLNELSVDRVAGRLRDVYETAIDEHLAH